MPLYLYIRKPRYHSIFKKLIISLIRACISPGLDEGVTAVVAGSVGVVTDVAVAVVQRQHVEVVGLGLQRIRQEAEIRIPIQ